MEEDDASLSVQERLLKAEEKRIVMKGRQQRREALLERQTKPNASCDMKTKLDQVFNVQPPKKLIFMPTKTHRKKRVDENWKKSMDTASMNINRQLGGIERKAGTRSFKQKILDQQKKEEEEEKALAAAKASAAEEEENDDNDDNDDDDDDYGDDSYGDDSYDDDEEDFEEDFESDNSKPNTKREEDENENENEKIDVPRVGERIEAKLERLGWTEWFEGSVQNVLDHGHVFHILFDDGEERDDVLLNELKLLPGQRHSTSTTSTAASAFNKDNKINDDNDDNDDNKETSNKSHSPLQRMESFSSPMENVRTSLDMVTKAINSNDDVPRHLISKLLRSLSHAEYTKEKGIQLASRLCTALQCLIDDGYSTTLVELNCLQSRLIPLFFLD
jgi:hypothetical protein